MNKINLVIRDASKKDVPEMLELVRKYERYDEEYARRYYDKYFARDKAVWEDTVFVAEVEGRVVGFIGYCNDYFSTDYSYWLGWFVVAEEFRGLNEGLVAKKLLKKGRRKWGRWKSSKTAGPSISMSKTASDSKPGCATTITKVRTRLF